MLRAFKMPRWLATLAILALAAICTPVRAQVTVGYFTDFDAGNTGPNAPITANGFTAVRIPDISTAVFSSFNIVMIDESSNGGYSAGLLSRVPDLTTYVQGGGSVIIHDRTVTAANTVIPGGAAIVTVRSLTADLDVVTPGTLVTNGPFGNINNTTLDGGNSSTHGFAQSATLPAGSVNILSNGPDPTHSAAFSFPLGGGFVYYSTIPLDFYLNGSGNNPPRDAFRNIYAPNMLAYEHALQVGVRAVPEPGAFSMLAGMGVSGLAFVIRRGRKA